MLGKYTGEAYNTMKKVTENIPYIPNKVYKNVGYNIYWYINQCGYLHVLKAKRIKCDEWKIIYYTIDDLLLTKDNMLKSTGQKGYYKTPEAILEALENELTA